MTPEERSRLQTAIHTLADPRGNWEFAWRQLLELGDLPAAQFDPPFRKRDLQAEVIARPEPEPHTLPPRTPSPVKGPE